jgi:hypothetical protein
MADAAALGIAAAAPDDAGSNVIDFNKAAVVANDDGGATVHLDGLPQPNPADAPFDSNLTEMFTETELGRLGSEMVQLVTQDESNRREWRDTYANGLKLLGLKYEERTDPWQGACGAFHPMLLESVIRFNAQAMTDLFPGSGPIKTQIVGRITDEKERRAERIKRDLNWMAQEKITGFREETDMMLFNLPLAGSTFRKWRFDRRRKFPAAEYVLPEHVVLPYSASSLASSDRYTIILPKTDNAIDALMEEGFYRRVEIGSGTNKTTPITEAKDKIEGKKNSNDARDALHRLYEVHIDWYFDSKYAVGDPLVTDKAVHPYTITVDSVSQKVLSIYRNWREGDAAMERQVDVVQHKYMPGFGPYGIGLINILGGLTDSASSILRQLVDAGTLSNLPAGYKTKSARVKDDSTPIGPAEWRDVDVGSDTLRDSFFPLPYKEPSTVLAALLGQIVDEGRRIGSVADMKITDMTGQNMPVGTTLAIIERSMKVMSAVQQRLYESFKQEYKVFAEIVKDFMGDVPYAFELDPQDQQATRKQDYDDQLVAVIPVADPNATTMAQRIMTVQAITTLYQSSPNAGWDTKALMRDAVLTLGSEKVDLYLPPDQQVQPADPVTENMQLMTSKPVKAGLEQDHEAHISIHMSMVQDPKILALLKDDPQVGAIASAVASHVREHMAFQYRIEIEKLLGVPLPTPDQPLPADVEFELSRLVSAAADKLLEKDTAEQKQKEILDALEDPVIQNERRALDIKQSAVDKRHEVDMAKLTDAAKNRDLELILKVIGEMAETERSTLAVEVQKGAAANESMQRAADRAADLTGTIMTEASKITQAGMKRRETSP